MFGVSSSVRVKRREINSYGFVIISNSHSNHKSELPRVCRRLHFLRGWSNEQTQTLSPEVRERAVRLVLEHQENYHSQWAALTSIADKIGCTAETLRKWVRRAEVDQGSRPGVNSSERERIRELERENRELKRANEILR